MIKLLIFATVILAAFAAPLVEELEEPEMKKVVDKGLTVEQFDGYLNIFKMFKDMLPKDLMATLESLNMSEKGELVSFITDWFRGNIKKPENKYELVELIKEKLPTVYDKIDQLNTTFYEKFNQLKPETQQLLRTWKDKATAIHGATRAESAKQQLQLLSEFGSSMQSMDAATKEDIRSQFPTAVKLTEGVGFTVLTTVAMVVQKVAESLMPAPAPECVLKLA